MHPIAKTYNEIIEGLPREHRREAQLLPYKIGLSDHPGGGWEDFSDSEALYDLPLFVFDKIDQCCPSQNLSDHVLNDFRHAHHCAGFWGLLSDRLADGQAKRNKTTDIFQDFFKQCWILSLTKATEKNNSEIVNLVNSAIADWEKGIRLERKFFRPGLLTVEDYTETIRLKVYWLSLTSICLLQSLDQQSQIKSFQLIYNMMLCGMQSRDDAMDFIEDEALNGISYPDALGVTPGSLYRNGLELLKKSSLLAKDLGFIKLSNWLDQNSQVHFQIRFDEFPELDILGGWMLSTQVEAKLKM